MNYIVFDLEWNQPNEAEQQNAELPLTDEIVEIGAVKLNDTFEPVDELRLLITPKFMPRMHHAIAALTGVHDKLLQKQGKPFPEAYAEFMTWCGEEYTFFTWSMSDVPVLAENMQAYGISLADLQDVVDVQRIFDREIMRTDRRVSLEEAMEVLGKKGEKAHDALNDAKNTVAVCGYLNLEEYLGEYVTHYFAAEDTLPDYDSPAQLLQADAVRSMECPWCGKPLECEPWLPYNANHQISYARCEEGDEFWVDLRWKRMPDGKCRVRRELYDMSDDLWDIYTERKSKNT